MFFFLEWVNGYPDFGYRYIDVNPCLGLVLYNSIDYTVDYTIDVCLLPNTNLRYWNEAVY